MGKNQESSYWRLEDLLPLDPKQSGRSHRAVTVAGNTTRVHHDVAVGKGRTLRLIEHFSPSSHGRANRLAVLFLKGPVFRGESWGIPVHGYDGVKMAAGRGLFAYTVDYLGEGDSYRPANGLEASFERNVQALRIVVEFIRRLRQIPKVAVVGEGYGGNIATLLAADSERIAACALTAMLYKYPEGGPSQSPEFVAQLQSSPNGYFHVPPEAYEPFLETAPSEVRDFILATQPGQYPTPTMLAVTGEPPFLDPSVATAPGLVIFGEQDFVVGRRDANELAADYGNAGAHLAVSPTAGHAPRVESPEVAQWFWEQVFSFIDPK